MGFDDGFSNSCSSEEDKEGNSKVSASNTLYNKNNFSN